MLKPVTNRHSARTIKREFGDYLKIQLESDPETQEEAALFGTAQDKFVVVMTDYGTAEDELLAALAIRDRKTQNLKGAMRRFATSLLSLAYVDHDAPLYRAYFPNGYGGVMQLHPEKITSFAVDIVERKLTLETDESIRELATALVSATAEAQEAYEAWKRAYENERHLWWVLSQEKLEWLVAYRRTRALLDARFLKQPGRAASYFRSVSDSRDGGGEDVVPDSAEDDADDGDEVSVPDAEGGAGSDEGPVAPGANGGSVGDDIGGNGGVDDADRINGAGGESAGDGSEGSESGEEVDPA